MPAAVPDAQCAALPVRATGALIDIGAVLLGFLATAVLWTATLGRPGAAVLILFAVGLQVGYPVVSETVTGGRSPGKIALGLRVVADDGGPERFRQALIRALAAVLEIWALAGIPALACSLLAPHGKRFGDVLAGTVVVDDRQRRPPPTPPPVPAMPPALAWWASSLQLAGLRPQTIAAADQFLALPSQLDSQAGQMMAYRISGAVLAQITPPPPPGTPPELILAAVLAELRRRESARVREAPGAGYRPPTPPGPPPASTGFAPP